MTLDICLCATEQETHCDPEACAPLHHESLPHALGPMAHAAGVKLPLWYPKESKVARAADLLVPVSSAVARLKAEPMRYKAHELGTAKYEVLLSALMRLGTACATWPQAYVRVSR